MKDPALLSTARERKLDISPMSGSELQTLVARHVGTEAATVKAAMHAVGLQ
jgi:hypothetical protein